MDIDCGSPSSSSLPEQTQASSSPMAMIQDDSSAFEHVGEILSNMMRQESTIYKRINYLDRPHPTEAQNSEPIDGSWRQRIIEWMYGVVDHCSLKRESVAVATFFLDLSAAKGLVLTRRDFQLVAMTSLMLSIKLYDSTLVKLDSMVKLGRGLFDERDVIATEMKMLKAMNWQVHPPTPVCFMRQFLRLLPRETTPIARYMIIELTRFISEISTCLQKFLPILPSTMAYASILIAMERIDASALSVAERKQFQANVQALSGIDLSTPDMTSTIDQLRATLDSNVNLQELLRTIDAQCSLGFNKPFEQEAGLQSKGEGPHSPRDVSSRVY